MVFHEKPTKNCLTNSLIKVDFNLFNGRYTTDTLQDPLCFLPFLGRQNSSGWLMFRP